MGCFDSPTWSPIAVLYRPSASRSFICSTLKVKLVQKKRLQHGRLTEVWSAAGVFYQSASVSPAPWRTPRNLKSPPPPNWVPLEFGVEGLMVGATLPPFGALIFVDLCFALIFVDQSTKSLLNVNQNCSVFLAQVSLSDERLLIQTPPSGFQRRVFTAAVEPCEVRQR